MLAHLGNWHLTVRKSAYSFKLIVTWLLECIVNTLNVRHPASFKFGSTTYCTIVAVKSFLTVSLTDKLFGLFKTTDLCL